MKGNFPYMYYELMYVFITDSPSSSSSSSSSSLQSSGESSGSAKKASATKTSRLEAEVNELNFQLRSAQKQKEDLQLEFEKLQVSLLVPKMWRIGFHSNLLSYCRCDIRRKASSWRKRPVRGSTSEKSSTDDCRSSTGSNSMKWSSIPASSSKNLTM